MVGGGVGIGDDGRPFASRCAGRVEAAVVVAGGCGRRHCAGTGVGADSDGSSTTTASDRRSGSGINGHGSSNPGGSDKIDGGVHLVSLESEAMKSKAFLSRAITKGRVKKGRVGGREMVRRRADHCRATVVARQRWRDTRKAHSAP